MIGEVSVITIILFIQVSIRQNTMEVSKTYPVKFTFYFNGEEGLRRSQMDSMDGDTCGRRWSGHGHSQITSSKSFIFIFKVKIRHHISLHEVWQSPCRFSVPLDLRSNYNIQIIKTIKINKNLCIHVWKMSFSFFFFLSKLIWPDVIVSHMFCNYYSNSNSIFFLKIFKSCEQYLKFHILLFLI